MTRATRVKGPPINREPFAELFTASYGLVSVGPCSQSSGLTAEIRHRNREQQHLSKEVKSMKEGRQDGRCRKPEAGQAGDLVLDSFGTQGIQPSGRQVSPQKPPEVGIVVDSLHHQTKHKQDYRVAEGLSANVAASTSTPIEYQGSQQTEEGR